jgi:hypothetical protein
MGDDSYNLSKAIPNKVLQEDGSITDFAGNPVTSTSKAFDLAKAIPNKVLMPDGTYLKLTDLMGGGGSGGTTDYSMLSNKPQINGVILDGNKTSEDLGLVQRDGEAPQQISTDVEIENGKNLTLKDEAGTSQSALSANADGTITATVKVGDETTTEQVAYLSDIDKKVTNVLGGEF